MTLEPLGHLPADLVTSSNEQERGQMGEAFAD